ncbi:hypothetical protein [Chryseobacterium viscerum]|uniref:hypothetical protein n=1 Tax=Chryseobacterium viscerum TaxID=1037377 RepID=UPI002223ED51|nr:hypothetical protein [Chryseobacterium viscerum]MCW1962059.1 hypothetical protein [Chryseobacterium viscerum]
MKKLIILLTCMLWSMTCINAQCPNGDAEMGNFSNWQTYVGSNTTGTLNLSTFTPSLSPTQHTVTGIGNDPILGASLPMVGEGSSAFRLGNSTAMNGAEIMSYTFTAGSSISFMYALVLQGAHSDSMINGFFSYWVSRTNDLASSTAPGNLVIGPVKINGSNVADPFLQTTSYNGEPLSWKEWQTLCLPIPSQDVGQQLTIYFATADCRDSGHFGYAYIDALCKPVPPVPVLVGPSTVCNIDDPILFSGSRTTNESQYVWFAQECDAMGNLIGTPPFAVIRNGPAGTYSLRSSGINLQSGHYYKVTLQVRNCTSGWVVVSKIVKIEFPPIQTSNKVICCGSSIKLRANVTAPGNGTVTSYKWYDEAGNFIGNGSLSFTGPIGGPFVPSNDITVTPTKCTKYRIEFEYNGCKNSQWVYVTLIQNVRGAFGCVSYNNCTGSGTVKFDPWIKLCGNEAEVGPDYSFHMQQATNSIKYSWNTGSTSDTSAVTGNTASTVTVTSVCGTNTATITPPVFTGAFPGLFKPTGMSVTNPFVIYNTMMNQYAIPAYNAYSYELSVYDRWGTRVYYKYETTCLGFYNGQIRWDGRYTPDANGNPGPYVNIPGVYSWNLKLTNCTGSENFKGDVTFIQ